MKNTPYITIFSLLLFFISCKQKNVNNTKIKQFTAVDSSLVQYEYPEWYQDAKIGYWVHWGIYSVPAFNGEWYGRHMHSVDDNSGQEKGKGFSKKGLEVAAHHRRKYGEPKDFQYHDFIPMFKAEKWDADEWATIFHEGGAKFFTMMAMHHDSYCLWDSKNTPYTSVKTGPKRDFVNEMKKAIKKRGMYFGVSNHSAWNGGFFSHKHINGIPNNNEQEKWLYGTGSVDANAIDRWWKLTTELADKYQPDLYYFDWGWNLKPFTEQRRKDFLAYYYNKAQQWNKTNFPAPNVVVNYKNKSKLPEGSAVLDIERGAMKGKYKHPWQTDTSLGLKWWNYGEGEIYRSPNQTIDMLMDIISKNGTLMLNIGPKADGSIPELAKKSIRSIGRWLKINGEAVYATRPWEIYGEGPTAPSEKMHGDQVEYTSKDIRFTRSKDNKTLYATFLGLPKNKARIISLKKTNIDLKSLESISVIENNTKVTWNQDNTGLYIEFPNDINNKSHAYALKLKFKNTIPTLLIK